MLEPSTGSESTISMPLASAKRNQLVRPAAVPDRDSVTNLSEPTRRYHHGKSGRPNLYFPEWVTGSFDVRSAKDLGSPRAAGDQTAVSLLTDLQEFFHEHRPHDGMTADATEHA